MHTLESLNLTGVEAKKGRVVSKFNLFFRDGKSRSNKLACPRFVLQRHTRFTARERWKFPHGEKPQFDVTAQKVVLSIIMLCVPDPVMFEYLLERLVFSPRSLW
jgi:hypothetical protein